MIGDTSKFDKLEEYDVVTIKHRNFVPCPMKGRGTLMLNDKIRFDDAYWVEGLKYKLLSIDQLNKTGQKIEF